MKPWYARFEKLTIITLVILACVFSFIYVNKLNFELAEKGGRFTELHTWLDDYIPFIPTFGLAYYLYYIWVLLAVPVTKEREHFYHAVASFTTIQAAAIATYIIFPSHMSRPQVVGNGIGEHLVRWMYKADPGFNLLPSLHVGHTMLVALLYYYYKRRYFTPVAIGTALISISTVFIKQHYIVDLPFGALYALGAFYLTAPVTNWVRGYASDGVPPRT